MQDEYDESKMFSQLATKGMPFSASPLNKYYRIPGLHITLPTGGKFLSEFEPAMDGTVMIAPIKAADDMMLKNPDSLMSGAALENLFLSCVPAIKNPREISMPDIDVLLIAIRAATYGDNIKFEVKCPKCGEEYDYNHSLNEILSTMTCVEEDTYVNISDNIVAEVRPYNLLNATKIALTAFEQARILQNLDQSTIEDEEENRKFRIETMNTAMAKVSDLNLRTIADCTISITVPEGKVTNKMEIFNFLKNISKSWKETIENRIKDMNNHGIDKNIDIQCPKCLHEWKTQLELDPTNFFDASF